MITEYLKQISREPMQDLDMLVTLAAGNPQMQAAARLY